LTVNLTMVVVDRRTWMIGATTTLTEWHSQQGRVTSSHLSFSDAVDAVCRYSPLDFRKSIKDSGNFLYRGETVDGPTILHPKPDLLLPGTYGYDDHDRDALKYFECLENELSNIRARPSTGHIGTGTQADASLWGSPVSVWPLGNCLSYVWPKERNLIYPGGICPRDQDLVIDNGLSTALEQGKEILFASWFEGEDNNLAPPPTFTAPFQSSYVVFPQSYDKDLRDLLSRKKYGL
jgi:hypothetical protein